MKISPLLVAAALCAAVLPAQTGPQVVYRLTTADVVGVHANRQTDLARGGVTIDPALRLGAVDGDFATAGSGAARVAMRTDGGPAVGGQFTVRGFAGDGQVAGTLSGNPPAAGAQTYTLTFAARQAVQGRVVVLFGGEARNARAGASVRIGRATRNFAADGTAQRGRFDGLTVDSHGLTVAVSIGGAARPQGSRAAYHANLRVLFVADRQGGGCTVSSGTSSCAVGGTLRGAVDTSGRRPVLNLGLRGALPDAIGITLVSPADRTFDIANTGCIFFLRPITATTFRTDSHGNARTSLGFPHSPGAGFAVQQATVRVSPRGVRFGTSNSLVVHCN